MRTLLLLAVALCEPCVARADDEERAKAIATQKAAAESAFKAMELGDFAHVETKHLLVYGPKEMEKRLDAVGKQLEKYHDTAAKALDLGKDAYPGKITVYLFAQKADLPRVHPPGREAPADGPRDGGAIRRPTPGCTPSPSPALPRGRSPSSVARGRCWRRCSCSAKRARGRTCPTGSRPASGARRATGRRRGRSSVADDRKQQRLLVKKRTAADAWDGKLERDEAEPLQASVAEFVVYGLSAARLAKLLNGFKPGENVRTKTTVQALDDANLTPGQLDKAWKRYVK